MVIRSNNDVAVRGGNHSLVGFGASIALLMALSANTAGTSAERADELLPVDCLLPGAVRKLGGRMTYVTQRRPIKTVAVDCEIRGGEYVAYDRADYGTAMRIWLPMAEQGDPKAQNYVGEIYEKGLGVSPNFTLAAQWYAKAAEQGYQAAQINLGQLHETGTGVEKDMAIAMQWYEKAAGVDKKLKKLVSFEPVVGARPAIPETALTERDRAIAEQQQKIQQLVQQLDASESRQQALIEKANKAEQSAESTSQQQRVLAQKEAELIEQRELLEQQRRELAQVGQEQQSSDEQLAARLALIEQQNKELQQQRSDLQKQLEQKEQVLDAKAQAAEQSSESVKRQQQEIAQKEAQLQQERQRLEQQRSSIELATRNKQSSDQALADKLAAIEDQKKELQRQRNEMQEKFGQQQQMDEQLSAQQAEMQRAQAELSKLKEAIAASRTSLAALSEASAQVASAAPVIQLIEPKVLRTRGESIVPARADLDERTVIGQVQSAAGLMELLINEKSAKIDENGFFQERVAVNNSVTPVTIVAIDKQGKRSDLSFNFEKKKAEQTALVSNDKSSSKKATKIPKLNYGSYHALVIGNKDYKSLPDLKTSGNDVEAVSKVLQSRYGFKVKAIRDATRYDILSALNEMRSELTEDDNLLIYYAGHGTLDEVNNRGHWMPVDAEENSTANWISNVAITDILNAMNAKKVLVVSDSCYSGAMTRSALARLDAGRSEKSWVSWLKMLSEKRSRLALSSGGLAPVLDGGGGEHSIFAKAFLDVLNTNETVIEGKQLHGKVAELVSYAASASQFEQVPQYAPIKFGGHESGDFLFVPRKI